MGIWYDAFIAPAQPTLLPSEAFGRLALDLARERVVRTPWALVAGELCVNASLNWESVSGKARWERPSPGTPLRTDEDVECFRPGYPPPWGGPREQATLLAKGDAVLDLLPALQSAPYGQQDVAVVFDHLDFGNRGIMDHFCVEDDRTMLVLFALARPQTRPLSACASNEPGGPTHTVQTCVAYTFKLAMEDGPAPTITSLLTRHLGPDLVSGETWG